MGDIRRLLGMTNQLGKFSPKLADMTKPMRDLLAKDSQWSWGEPQRRAEKLARAQYLHSLILTD